MKHLLPFFSLSWESFIFVFHGIYSKLLKVQSYLYTSGFGPRVYFMGSHPSIYNFFRAIKIFSKVTFVVKRLPPYFFCLQNCGSGGVYPPRKKLKTTIGPVGIIPKENTLIFPEE